MGPGSEPASSPPRPLPYRRGRAPGPAKSYARARPRRCSDGAPPPAGAAPRARPALAPPVPTHGPKGNDHPPHPTSGQRAERTESTGLFPAAPTSQPERLHRVAVVAHRTVHRLCTSLWCGRRAADACRSSHQAESGLRVRSRHEECYPQTEQHAGGNLRTTRFRCGHRWSRTRRLSTAPCVGSRLSTGLSP